MIKVGVAQERKGEATESFSSGMLQKKSITSVHKANELPTEREHTPNIIHSKWRSIAASPSAGPEPSFWSLCLMKKKLRESNVVNRSEYSSDARRRTASVLNGSQDFG